MRLDLSALLGVNQVSIHASVKDATFNKDAILGAYKFQSTHL